MQIRFESIHSAFVLYFDSHGLELDIPQSLLQTIFLCMREEFVTYLDIPYLHNDVSGLYRSDVSRGCFFDTLGRSDVRETNKQINARGRDLKKMRRRVTSADPHQRFGWKLKHRAERQVSKSEARWRAHTESLVR